LGVAQGLLCITSTCPVRRKQMNKPSNPRKKLVLSRETVRHLSTDQLQGVVGGMINLSRITQCECPSRLGCEPDPGVSRVHTACTQP